MLNGGIGWVTDRDLASNLHATQDVGILAVSVGSLIQVHEIHVNG